MIEKSLGQYDKRRQYSTQWFGIRFNSVYIHTKYKIFWHNRGFVTKYFDTIEDLSQNVLTQRIYHRMFSFQYIKSLSSPMSTYSTSKSVFSQSSAHSQNRSQDTPPLTHGHLLWSVSQPVSDEHLLIFQIWSGAIGSKLVIGLYVFVFDFIHVGFPLATLLLCIRWFSMLNISLRFNIFSLHNFRFQL